MFLIKPSFSVETPLDSNSILQSIEAIGRTCYKSEKKITPDSATDFCRMLINKGHLSVIEHISLSVRFVIDRGVSHELVRHRLASFSQESTRYCDYKGGVTFVIPPWCKGLRKKTYKSFRTQNGARIAYSSDTQLGLSSAEKEWLTAMAVAEQTYCHLRKSGPDGKPGWTPQQARSVLPNALKTEIVMTANLREWRHVFSLRCSPKAHSQMQEVMIPLRDFLQEQIPVVFE